ncbi:MAG: rhodanese-like domain-containing protein [Kaistella sp.]
MNIPLAKIKDNIDFFKKQKNIVVFCNSGKQAAEAIDILKQNGVQNVYSAKTLKNVEAIQNEK